MRLGFFVNSSNVSQDCIDDLSYNKGMGGTEFLTFALIKTILLANPDTEIIIYTNNLSFSFKGANVALARSAADAISIFDNDYGFFIGNFSVKKEIPHHHLKKAKIIIWGHHFFDKDLVKEIGKRSDVHKIVFLTKTSQQYYFFNRIYSKSCVIGHYMANNNKTFSNAVKNEKIVCYIGSLYPYKHCHVVLDNWSKIRKKCPDAKLIIIGSSKLYDKGLTMGDKGVATPDYEKRLFKNVKSEDLSSIFFAGLRSQKEINDILKSVKVGVVNPIGTTETFCLSAFDFANNRIPVVTARFGGLIDTVTNKYGYLTISNYSLRKKITSALNKQVLLKGESYYEYVSSNFDYDTFKDNWIHLLFSNDNTYKKRTLIDAVLNIFYYTPTKYIAKIRRFLNR